MTRHLFYSILFLVVVLVPQSWGKSLFDPSTSLLKIYDLAVPGSSQKYYVELFMDLSNSTFQIIEARDVFPFNGCYAGTFSGADNGRIIFCVRDDRIVYGLAVSHGGGFYLESEGTVSPSGEITFFLNGDGTHTEVTGKLSFTEGSGSWLDHIEHYSGSWTVQKLEY